MAKLKTDPIAQADLIEYLNDHSDFSFELNVLKSLVASGFTCEHGGTYADPVTHRPRQFDIRATRIFDLCFLRLAVECKNLRPNFPLLISCLPRRVDEAFHELVVSADPDFSDPWAIGQWVGVNPKLDRQPQTVRLDGSDSLYEPGEPVGKSCEQIGRTLHNNDITANDAEVYDKWSQALSSAHDLIYLANNDVQRTRKFAISLVIPVVVVPNGRLWFSRFDQDGNRTADPTQTNRCSYFVGRSYSALAEFTVSHLEFVTLDGLTSLVGSLCGSDADNAFPGRPILNHLHRATGIICSESTDPP